MCIHMSVYIPWHGFLPIPVLKKKRKEKNNYDTITEHFPIIAKRMAKYIGKDSI